MNTQTIHIEACYISPGHNFFGHHGKEPGQHKALPADSISCHTGKGIEGDRFYNFKENYKGQITFLEREQIDLMEKELKIPDIDPSKFRRNVITRGIDLNTLIGKQFELGGIQFEGVQECTPCYWMNRAVGEGAEECLKGKGGLRARILSDGELKTGDHELVVL